MFLARWNSARLCIAWVNGRLARMQRCDRVMGVRVSNLGSLCDPSLVSVIRKPKIPLLPLWEKGVGGMRGKNARECRKPLISSRNFTLESPRGQDARVPRRTAPSWGSDKTQDTGVSGRGQPVMSSHEVRDVLASARMGAMHLLSETECCQAETCVATASSRRRTWVNRVWRLNGFCKKAMVGLSTPSGS